MYQEIWKNIEGYEGLYWVSNLGRIKTIYKSNRRKNSDGLLSTDSISGKGRGYPFVCLYKNGQAKQRSVHRLVAETFIPNPENRREVNHKDGNKNNNISINLEWMSSAQNRLHASIHGLLARGERNGQSKFTETEIISIREEYRSGIAPRFIAKKFNIARSYVHAIVNKEVWAHL